MNSLLAFKSICIRISKIVVITLLSFQLAELFHQSAQTAKRG